MWQPIPVYETDEKDCPRYDAAFEQYMNKSEDVQEIYREYADQFSYWSHMCGMPIETTDDAYFLYNSLSIEKQRLRM